MCGIGGILRILKPGDADYPGDEALRAPSGAWLWHGREVRDLAYRSVEPGATTCPEGQAVRSQGAGSSWIIPESWLDAIDDHIAWRGPDGAGRFRDRVVKPDGTIVEVALVHRRLSIIDLEGGAQPMVVTRCPRCAELASSPAPSGGGARVREGGGGAGVGPPLSAIVFNGCIYNHRELRAELEAKGHVFESDHSDTEVVLHLMSEQNEGSGMRLDGMFALMHWDRAQGSMTVARDGFGEKPLYVLGSLFPRGLVGASVVTPVRPIFDAIRSPYGERRSPSARTPFDPRALTDWIALGYGIGPMPLEHVFELSPDSTFAIGGGPDDGRAKRSELAHAAARAAVLSVDLAFHGLGTIVKHNLRGRRPRGIRNGDALDSLMAEAVRSRLDADVPVGCFLSGGIDSSLVSFYASREFEGLTTLCVRMPDERYDESVAAQTVANALGTRHITIDAQQEAACDLVHIIETMGLPFGDSSVLPTYWVCRAAAQVVKVALSGDGGDELFYGYDRYRAARWLAGFGWLIGMVPLSLLRRDNPRSRSEKLARLVNAALLTQWYHELMAVFQRPDRRSLLGKGKGYQLGEPFMPPHFKPRETDLTHYLPGDLLRKVDTASMMCGLEVRCPMLARKLSEAAIATPRGRLTRGGPKGMLRELARRHLPREIVDRPKQGFAIPISDWWRTNFGGLQDLLLDMLAGDKPFGAVHDVLEINMGFVRQMLDEHWAAGGLTPMHTTRHVRRRDHGQRLFALVSLAIWARSIHRRDAENAEIDTGLGSRQETRSQDPRP